MCYVALRRCVLPIHRSMTLKDTRVARHVSFSRDILSYFLTVATPARKFFVQPLQHTRTNNESNCSFSLDNLLELFLPFIIIYFSFITISCPCCGKDLLRRRPTDGETRPGHYVDVNTFKSVFFFWMLWPTYARRDNNKANNMMRECNRSLGCLLGCEHFCLYIQRTVYFPEMSHFSFSFMDNFFIICIFTWKSNSSRNLKSKTQRKYFSERRIIFFSQIKKRIA